MGEYPTTLKSLKDEELTKVHWKDVKDGNIIYLFATHEGKSYGTGPFCVISAKERKLTRCDSNRWFMHYPEELYRLKI